MTQTGKSILMVEDDPFMARVIQFRLSREGYVIRHAADGQQGLKEFDAGPVTDLVILDVMMPYHNGFELLANLRSRPAWSAVPVLMLTSMGREEDVVRGLDGGASDYMIKPFRPAELVARVRKILG